MFTEPSKLLFGARLATLRKAAGLTQEQLGEGLAADGSDVGKGAISSWEVGRTEPSPSQITKLCARLKCTPNDLIAHAPLNDKRAVKA
jgi:transcriptional regulator with XRE-family HTH domain